MDGPPTGNRSFDSRMKSTIIEDTQEHTTEAITTYTKNQYNGSKKGQGVCHLWSFGEAANDPDYTAKGRKNGSDRIPRLFWPTRMGQCWDENGCVRKKHLPIDKNDYCIKSEVPHTNYVPQIFQTKSG